MGASGAYFALSICLLALAFWHPLVTLVSLGLGSGHDADQYSHIMIIPLLCLYLVLRKRKLIFADAKSSIGPGISLLVSGLSFFVIAKLKQGQLGQEGYFSLLMTSFVVLVIGAFVLFFGTRAFRLARFPLLVLALMIPFPSWFLGRTVSSLQDGSAVVTAFLLNLTGMPFVREGLVFHLPTNLNIFIAYDCSGIRSSIALLIASLVASDIFLRKGWKKLVLNLAVLPLSLFKNGLRIATLSLLSVYVDPRFISGDLHRDGGILFYLIACGILGLLLWQLRKSEAHPAFVTPAAHHEAAASLKPIEAPFKKQTV
ncbi:MAG TPA: exosortase/archaeosortase family protein [Candidatus Acidoferrales bacterium]|nr:exosortase/archaeosortase family protein [Candidatus Acidoferrales bacterium]